MGEVVSMGVENEKTLSYISLLFLFLIFFALLSFSICGLASDNTCLEINCPWRIDASTLWRCVSLRFHLPSKVRPRHLLEDHPDSERSVVLVSTIKQFVFVAQDSICL
jgi:hypothetical protein